MNRSSNVPILILASSSPRRQQLLEQTGLCFRVVPSLVDENTAPLSSPHTHVRYLAEAKAKAVAGKYHQSWVVAADTIVVIDDAILTKPASEQDAYGMLKKLSGRTHQVFTGYTVCCHSKGYCFSDAVTTDVVFKQLTENEIQWYLQTREPFDKAGAYAIQGMGAFMVKSIRGSYTNVVGLPLCEVVEHLEINANIRPGMTIFEIGLSGTVKN